MTGPGGDKWRAATHRLDQLDSRWVGVVALIIAMGISAALLLWLERDALFASDEWAWIYISGTGSLSDTLHPINQHLMVVPLLIFKAFLSIWGVSMLPFKLAEIVGVLACSWLVYVYSRRRLGPILALAPAMMPLFFGTATSIVLQPLIGVQLIYAVSFGLAALIAVEQDERRWDVAAALLLCLSVSCYSSGLAFLAGVTVAVLLDKRRSQRAFVFLIPLVFYLAVRIWGLQFGTGGSPSIANVPILPFYFVDALAATTTSLFGRGSIVGNGPGTSLFLGPGFSLEAATTTLVFATLEVVVIVYAARRIHGRGGIPVTLWAVLAVLVTLWTLQGLVLTDGRTPGENRYLYSGAVVLLLVVVEVARSPRLSRLGVVLVLALAVAGIAGNLPRFREGRDGIVLHSTTGRAYAAAMELAGSDADPSFNPVIDTPEAATAGVLNFSAQAYEELRERYGSFAYSLPELYAQSEEVRHGADEVMTSMLRLQLTDVPSLSRRSCFGVESAGAGELVELPRGGAVLSADGDTPVSLRRFADREVVPLGELSSGRPTELAIPSDRARPWELWALDPVDLTVCPPPRGKQSQG
jgi:hypothetical protein